MTYRNRTGFVVLPVLLLAGLSFAMHAKLATSGHIPPASAVVWAAATGTVLIQLMLSWLNRPYTCDAPELDVAVIVPCYNEDPALLDRVLCSLASQTRLPERVIVVDDGSKVDYTHVRRCWPAVTWVRQDNAGKKHAHAAGWAQAPEADVYVTIDSDSALERRALDQALRPFADPRVMGVAGVEWASNYEQNLLTRAIGARSLAFQLFSMSSQSAAAGSVLIAPGAFSLFRGDMIRECSDAYVNESLCGMPVRLGDDTMLTFMALMAGRVVQQPTAVAFPAYPETMSHHIRQWMRWMRASTIRSIWRLRYLPATSYAWWFSVWQLGAFTAGIAQTVLVIAAWPASRSLLIASGVALVIWPAIVATRLGCIRRSDVSMASTLAGVALLPIAALWYLLVLRQLRLLGIATIFAQGWATRGEVEVRLHEQPSRSA